MCIDVAIGCFFLILTFAINIILSPLLMLVLPPFLLISNEEWLFIGTFKVRTLPRMINKEVSAKFIDKPI